MSKIIQTPNAFYVENREIIQNATRESLKGTISDEAIETFIKAVDTTSSESCSTATGSIYFGLIFGVVTCTPGHYPYYFEERTWGLGVSALGSAGLLCSSYGMEDLFASTTGFYAQGIAKGGGVFQVTFFDDELPIGQYNAVAGGVAAFGAGGSGKWRKK